MRVFAEKQPGRKFWARPVKPFGRGRPWLRWTRAVMQIQFEGKGEDCSVARLRCGAPSIAPRKEASERRKYGQYGRWRGLQANLFGGTAERYGAREDTQSDRVGDSGFMRQR